MARKPKRIGSGNQYKSLHTTNLHGTRRRPSGKKKSSRNTQSYNEKRSAVRQAQTRLKHLREMQTKTHSQRRRTELGAQIGELEAAIEATRTYSRETGKRIRDKAEVGRNVAELSRLNRTYDTLAKPKEQRRRNELTQAYINMASLAGPTVSPYTRAQVRIFYRATQEAWQNVDVDRRNEAIMAYYGTNNLADLFDDIVNDTRNQQVQWAIDVMENPSEHTEEDRAEAFSILSDNEDTLRYLVTGDKAADEDVSPVARV